MRMEVSLRQIAYLVRLIEKGSFTAAAESLGITQPALSIAIGQLERALEVVLVDRQASPLALTEAGAIFLRYARRVQHDLAEARDELAAHGRGALGRLDLCMGPSAATPEVGAVLNHLAADFPGLEIGIGTGVVPAVLNRLEDGEFTAYVGTLPDNFSDPRFEVWRMVDLEVVVIASAQHPLARKGRIDIADIVAAPWIAIGNIESNLPNWRAGFEALGAEPPVPAINVRNLALVHSLLGQGHFVTALPRSMVAGELAHGMLVPLLPERLSWTVPLSVLVRRGRVLPAATALFVERLAAQFGQMPADKFDKSNPK
jgi:DNA-binding transcriptional LysR family regulator